MVVDVRPDTFQIIYRFPVCSIGSGNVVGGRFVSRQSRTEADIYWVDSGRDLMFPQLIIDGLTLSILATESSYGSFIFD